jgi:hypothetical protein
MSTRASEPEPGSDLDLPVNEQLALARPWQPSERPVVDDLSDLEEAAFAYPWRVAVNRVDLSPALRDALERARPAVEAELAVRRQHRVEREPLPVEVRDTIERLIADGTYAKAVAAVVAEEPDLADG